MRLGLFLNFEHGPDADAANASSFGPQMDLSVYAERLGYDELWVSEHHFNRFSQSGSTLPLMAYLAARTSKIRIGSAAILLPLHDPIRVAEDLATIDILSGGRLDLGLARGGPFPLQYNHFHVAADDARDQTQEGTDFLLRLLQDEKVSFSGRWYKSDGLTIWPRPLQKSLPIWVASSTKETIIEAGKRGWGLMAGHGASPAKITELVETYKSAAPASSNPDFMVLRNTCIADTDQQALDLAMPAIERFIRGMRPMFASATPVDAPVPASSIDGFLAHALIGSPETCRRKLAELCANAPVTSIVLKQTWIDPSKSEGIIRRFRTEVMPVMAEDEPRRAAQG
jgi:luciferase family oxidoreductase group 1